MLATFAVFSSAPTRRGPKLTEHVADVSVPRQGPQLVLAPGEAFVVVPGELHHLKTGGDGTHQSASHQSVQQLHAQI